MIHGTIDATPIGINTTNRDIVDCDNGGEHHHGEQVPETGVPGESEAQAQDIRSARPPVAIQNGCAAEPTKYSGTARGIFRYTRRRVQRFSTFSRQAGVSGVGATKRGSRGRINPGFPLKTCGVVYYLKRMEAIALSKAGRKFFSIGA